MNIEMPLPEVNPEAPFSLVTAIYEQEIAKRNGNLNLSKINRKNISKEELESYKKLVPIYTHKHYAEKKEKKIIFLP